MILDGVFPDGLNKAAAPDGVLCVGAGKPGYVGQLDVVDWRRHALPVVVVGVAGKFEFATHPGKRLRCRAAVVPAGVRHALWVGGNPVAVFYPEPSLATLSDLTRLGGGWDAVGPVLLGQTAEVALVRGLHDGGTALGLSGEVLGDRVD